MNEREISTLKSKLTGVDSPQDLYHSRLAADRAEVAQRSHNRRANGKLVEALLKQVGVDTEKLDHQSAANSERLRRAIKDANLSAETFRSSIQESLDYELASRRANLDLLALPHASHFVTLDKPFWIRFEELDIFTEDHIQPANNWMKLLVNVNSGSIDRRAHFYFIWSNPSDEFALMNVSSSLSFTGNCSVAASPGIFSGSSSELGITAWLGLLRWSGWPPRSDGTPVNESSPLWQQSQYQVVTWLNASAGGFWSDLETSSAPPFVMTPFDFSHRLFAVAPHAVVIFTMTVHVWYAVDGGGNISDSVSVDFATNENKILCPWIQLEVLTPVPTMVGSR